MPPVGEHPDQPQARAHFPDSATTLAKVGHRQTHEAVAPRFQLHPLQQFVCAALVRRARRCLGAQPLQLRGEPVTDTLQLPQVQQRGAILMRADGRWGVEVGKAVGYDRGEITLEPRDLRTQRLARPELGVVALARLAIPCAGPRESVAARRPVA